MVSAKQMAEMLDRIEYPVRLTKTEVELAKISNLLIIYGASDDLIEFQGSFTDEAGCYEGGTVRIDTKGILPPFDEVEHNPDAVSEWFRRKVNSQKIEVLWCEEEGYSWTYKTDIPHLNFEVVEDGEPYCRGMVIDLEDMYASMEKEAS